jgi:hypothetical protein
VPIKLFDKNRDCKTYVVGAQASFKKRKHGPQQCPIINWNQNSSTVCTISQTIRRLVQRGQISGVMSYRSFSAFQLGRPSVVGEAYSLVFLLITSPDIFASGGQYEQLGGMKRPRSWRLAAPPVILGCSQCFRHRSGSRLRSAWSFYRDGCAGLTSG